MVESSIVVYKNTLVDWQKGSAAQVEFDFLKLWQFKNKKRIKKFRPYHLAFYHVHPEGFLDYSQKDLNCMKGLNIAFDYNVYFSIICFKNSDLHDMSYNRVNFNYFSGEVERLYNYPLKKHYLMMLKFLSYGGDK